ncbi:MAG TPA: hypothetical protein VHD60_03405 [Candidatus Saccharimonadales bacterium]|nr:hypothetical protein [Candidatus Saccharimonadales bacterium]
MDVSESIEAVMRARETTPLSFWQKAGRAALTFYDGILIFAAFAYGIEPSQAKEDIAAGRIARQVEVFVKDVTVQLHPEPAEH